MSKKSFSSLVMEFIPYWPILSKIVSTSRTTFSFLGEFITLSTTFNTFSSFCLTITSTGFIFVISAMKLSAIRIHTNNYGIRTNADIKEFTKLIKN